MKCEAMKKSAKTYYFSLLKPLLAAIIVVFSGLSILSEVIFSAIITTLFALFAVIIWGFFFLSEILYLNREYQWHSREKQA
jgi:hypothetical protein